MQFLGNLGKIVCWRPPGGLAPQPRGNPGSATGYIQLNYDPGSVIYNYLQFAFERTFLCTYAIYWILFLVNVSFATQTENFQKQVCIVHQAAEAEVTRDSLLLVNYPAVLVQRPYLFCPATQEFSSVLTCKNSFCHKLKYLYTFFFQ